MLRVNNLECLPWGCCACLPHLNCTLGADVPLPSSLFQPQGEAIQSEECSALSSLNLCSGRIHFVVFLAYPAPNSRNPLGVPLPPEELLHVDDDEGTPDNEDGGPSSIWVGRLLKIGLYKKTWHNYIPYRLPLLEHLEVVDNRQNIMQKIGQDFEVLKLKWRIAQ